MVIHKHFDIDIDMVLLKNINIDIEIHENIDIVLQNINLDKILYRLALGKSNRAFATWHLPRYMNSSRSCNCSELTPARKRRGLGWGNALNRLLQKRLLETRTTLCALNCLSSSVTRVTSVNSWSNHSC